MKDRIIAALWNPARDLFVSSGRFYWVYMICATVFSIAVFIQQTNAEGRSARGFFLYLFPKSIYGHKSALTDFVFFGVNKLLYWLLVGPWLLEVGQVSKATSSLLSLAIPSVAVSQGSSVLKNFAFTIVTAVAVDFGLFLGHWLMHRAPVLWEFHKVHHSAEVMTPISSFRQHPVDDIISLSISAAFGGIAEGVFVHFLGRPQTIAIFGLNLLIFIFYIFGYNLRHSHVWLSYGPRISKVFVSPAAHQIHHSRDPQHFDKNLGIMFALWDWAFGTLHIPKENEKIVFGLGTEEEGEYHSVWRLYTRPFVAIRRNRSQMFVMSRSVKTVLVLILGTLSVLFAWQVFGGLFPMKT